MTITDNDPVVAADTTDLKAFLDECDRHIEGMVQQAIHARSGTALGGHPNPAYFFGRSAQLLKAMVDRLRKEEAVPRHEVKEEPATSLLNSVTVAAQQRQEKPESKPADPKPAKSK